MTETSQFNIGGTIYKVSRSLLASHPESMLAKISSERWQEDPEAEIFIERNGNRFQYVLDYMRDGEVELPITESKASILAELEYYGVEVDEDAVSDAREKQAVCVTSLKRGLADLKVKMKEDAMDSECSKLAYDIMSAYTSLIGSGKQNFNHMDLGCDANSTVKRENLVKLRSYKKDKLVLRKVNSHLKKFGLEVPTFGTNFDYRISVNEVKLMNANRKAIKSTSAKRARTE